MFLGYNWYYNIARHYHSQSGTRDRLDYFAIVRQFGDLGVYRGIITTQVVDFLSRSLVLLSCNFQFASHSHYDGRRGPEAREHDHHKNNPGRRGLRYVGYESARTRQKRIWRVESRKRGAGGTLNQMLGTKPILVIYRLQGSYLRVFSLCLLFLVLDGRIDCRCEGPPTPLAHQNIRGLLLISAPLISPISAVRGRYNPRDRRRWVLTRIDAIFLLRVTRDFASLESLTASLRTLTGKSRLVIRGPRASGFLCDVCQSPFNPSF